MVAEMLAAGLLWERAGVIRTTSKGRMWAKMLAAFIAAGERL